MASSPIKTSLKLYCPLLYFQYACFLALLFLCNLYCTETYILCCAAFFSVYCTSSDTKIPQTSSVYRKVLSCHYIYDGFFFLAVHL